MSTDISFCPLCAGKLAAGEDEQFVCEDCETEFFIQVVEEGDEDDEDEELIHRRNALVLDQVFELRLALLTNRGAEGDFDRGAFNHLSHVFFFHAESFGDLVHAGTMTKLLRQMRYLRFKSIEFVLQLG